MEIGEHLPPEWRCTLQHFLKAGLNKFGGSLRTGRTWWMRSGVNLICHPYCLPEFHVQTQLPTTGIFPLLKFNPMSFLKLPQEHLPHLTALLQALAWESAYSELPSQTHTPDMRHTGLCFRRGLQRRDKPRNPHMEEVLGARVRREFTLRKGDFERDCDTK